MKNVVFHVSKAGKIYIIPLKSRRRPPHRLIIPGQFIPFTLKNFAVLYGIFYFLPRKSLLQSL
ncbi:MAG: hypothetical protein ACI3X6_02825 [Alloprevotella sp.]